MPTVVTRQWHRDGAPISGATGLTYVLTSADVGAMMTCVETGTNTAGSVDATSNALGPVAALPVVDAQTKLLLHFDNNLTDSSLTPKTVTAVGNAAPSSAQSKFGGYSCAFDGSGDYLTVPDSADWDFGSGDFTVECFARLNNLNSNVAFMGQWDNAGVATNVSWGLYISSGSLTFWGSTAGGSGVTAAHNWSSRAINTWYHLAASRQSGAVRLFVEGTVVGTNTMNFALAQSNMPLSIGRLGGAATNYSAYDLNGYLDEVRISKGIARYTAAFTPPSAPF